MKPSSDIALFTTTLFPVVVSLILVLTAAAYADAVRTGGSRRPLCPERAVGPDRGGTEITAIR
jgi:hypothetical protein